MTTLPTLLSRIRDRLAGQGGFTMIVALGAMVVTSLLISATFVALDGEAHLSQSDLDGKRAYYAAQAGLNAYLYQLNTDSTYWQTCANNTTVSGTSPTGWTAVPGNSNEFYRYSPELANGNSSCSNTNVVNSMIDTNSGGLSMTFQGKSGTGANATITRGIVATFKRASPLQYLWYTVYEALDSSVGSTYSGCGAWYRQGRPSQCEINWVTGDSVNGPMYTQDQLMIPSGAAPVFGRRATDTIATLASSLCDTGCANAVFTGTVATGVNVPEPADNSALLTDAQNNGKVYNGTTTIALSGTTANVTNCPTSSTCTSSAVDITQYPIIYVQNASGCSPGPYSPYAVTYSSSGCTGDVYISGNYSSALTVAAANNIIVTGDVTTSSSGSTLTGNAVLGLVANQFVRVQHQVSSSRGSSVSSCNGATNTVAQTNPTIDAAILALQHSFIVDNFDCGAAMGTLTVNGAIVQKFRGPVGTTGTGTGYLKAYTYDDRLKYLAPPYLFDIITAAWTLTRENQCVVSPVAAQASQGC
jgi:Tfp pilus assembly protein PilX